MSDKTCKTCRWWQEDEDHRVKLTNAKKCANPKVAFAKQQDASENYDGDYVLVREHSAYKAPLKPIPPDEAGVLDGSGYWGALFTGPDFGCIHHEPPQTNAAGGEPNRRGPQLEPPKL